MLPPEQITVSQRKQREWLEIRNEWLARVRKKENVFNLFWMFQLIPVRILCLWNVKICCKKRKRTLWMRINFSYCWILFSNKRGWRGFAVVYMLLFVSTNIANSRLDEHPQWTSISQPEWRIYINFHAINLLLFNCNFIPTTVFN